MLSSTFWTEPHFTGVVLILGALLFLGGASLYTPIKDEKGSFIFGLPPESGCASSSLTRVCGCGPRSSSSAGSWRRFWAGHAHYAVVGRRGSSVLTPGSDLIAFAFGAVLWVISLLIGNLLLL